MKRILFLAVMLVVAIDVLAGAPPVITTQPTNQVAAFGGRATFTVGLSGTGPFNYRWQFNGTNLPSVVTTVAGNGTSDYAEGAAIYVGIGNPSGVAVDAPGNIYIAESFGDRVRKVDTEGRITTVAGNGLKGFSGDGGLATNARLQGPGGVAVDRAGNLFFADVQNFRIRKVGTNGIISTVAGSGPTWPAEATYSGDGGAATNARLDQPTGLAVDASGNLYIADGGIRIRKVGTNGIITTVTGNGTPGFSGDGGPATNASVSWPILGIAVDIPGNLFFGEWSGNRVRKVGTDGIITTVAGNGFGAPFLGKFSGDGGPATNATLSCPCGVAVDAWGNLFIADSANQRIREVGNDGSIRTVAGDGTGNYGGESETSTNAPRIGVGVIAVDGTGNLLIADAEHNRIRRVVIPGATLAINNVNTTNAGHYNVVVSSPSGSVTSSVVSLTVATGSSPAPVKPKSALNRFEPTIITEPTNQVAVIGSGVTFAVGLSGAGPFTYQWQFNGTNLPGIATVAGNGTTGYSGDGGAATNAGLSEPSDVAIDGLGNFFIADRHNHRIRKVSTDGMITTVAGNGSKGFSGDGGPAAKASLFSPSALAVDPSGNLFIADYDNDRVRRVGTDGIISTVAGNGPGFPMDGVFVGDGGPATNAGIINPVAVAVDAGGNLFIAELGKPVRKMDPGINIPITYYSARIRKVGTNGVITTVAGNGKQGLSGDGGAATNASLKYPAGIAVDGYGNLFIVESLNNCIRKVGTNGIITTVAGNGSDDPSARGFLGDRGPATRATLAFPCAVAVDGLGNLFIADAGNYRIREVGLDGIIHTVVGDGTPGYSGEGGFTTIGPGSPARGIAGGGIAIDRDGSVLIADATYDKVRRASISGPTLVINKVTAKNAGDYRLMVTSPFGNVTSSVVSLNVTLSALPLPVKRP